jgi:ElaB/YqjD/DUF883 family membrane-anchored ribosome-binding protein
MLQACTSALESLSHDASEWAETFTTQRTNQSKEQKTMVKETKDASDVMGTLSEDAGALLAATANMPGEKINEARKHLAAALERGREIYGRVREKAVLGAKATHQAVHQHPYQAIGITFGVAALIGYLLARRSSRNGN